MYLVFVLLFFKTVSSGNLGNCVCVPFWLCKDANEQYFDPSTTCPDYFDVCCKINCGKRNSDNLPFVNSIRNRILGVDNVATFAEFPWMLAILHEDKTYRCGGSLIHPLAAITAAHCVYGEDRSYSVRAGEWDWRNEKEPRQHEDRLAKEVIIHPKFDHRSLINDIAFILLDTPFSITDHIGIVCLPPHNFSPHLNSECVVSGWGRTTANSKELRHPILRKASLPIVWSYECTQALQRELLGPLFHLDKSFICAGGGNKDTCKGDGGSPLICEVENEGEIYEQFGIVSWGLTCGHTKAPGVYVSVSRFVNWIDAQMNSFKLDVRVYKRK